MFYLILAGLVVLVHLAFVAFVVFGALLAAKWPRAVWLHVPAVAWGALVEILNLACPLTPVENWLRQAGGDAGYTSDFLEHYVLAVLYPQGLTRSMQLAEGLAVVALNVAVYGWILCRKTGRRRW
jgi:hypothetical protein